MNISFFKMDDDYVCSTEIEDQFDFENLCNKLVSFSLKERLLEAVPELCEGETRDKIEVTAEWGYEGFVTLIYGVKLSDDEIGDFIRVIDQVKKLKLCDMSWSKGSDQGEFTRVVFAYDYLHYHKVLVDAHRFIIMTPKGLDEFLETLGMTHDFLPLEYERIATKLHFVHDKQRELEARKEKLRGDSSLPEVNFRRL